MARYRRARSSYRPRRAPARRRPVRRRRKAAPRTQRIVIQLVQAPGGPLAAATSLGMKQVTPQRRRF